MEHQTAAKKVMTKVERKEARSVEPTENLLVGWRVVQKGFLWVDYLAHSMVER